MSELAAPAKALPVSSASTAAKEVCSLPLKIPFFFLPFSGSQKAMCFLPTDHPAILPPYLVIARSKIGSGPPLSLMTMSPLAMFQIVTLWSLWLSAVITCEPSGDRAIAATPLSALPRARLAIFYPVLASQVKNGAFLPTWPVQAIFLPPEVLSFKHMISLLCESLVLETCLEALSTSPPPKKV